MDHPALSRLPQTHAGLYHPPLHDTRVSYMYKSVIDRDISGIIMYSELPLNEFPLKTEVDPPLTQYVSPFRYIHSI